MNFSRQLILPLTRLSARHCCDDGRPMVRSAFLKLKQTQKKFQVDDGVPVFLKKGFSDKILYNTTLFSCIFGALWSVTIWIQLIMKR